MTMDKLKGLKEKFNSKKAMIFSFFALLLVPGTVSAETGSGPDSGLIDTFVGMVTDVIALFMEPPLSWFVYLGLVAAAIGIVKRLIPRRSAR